jgi:periplasmic protein TonB
MPDPQAQSGNPLQGAERRQQSRHPARSLAYLDIGEGNGGIVLNVGEGGVAIQAVTPLEGDSLFGLRVQIPKSTKKLETNGRLAWLSTSKKEAGFAFVDLCDETRLQIRHWLSSEGVPGYDLTAKSTPPETTRPPAPKRTDKWIKLVAEQTQEGAIPPALERPQAAPPLIQPTETCFPASVPAQCSENDAWAKEAAAHELSSADLLRAPGEASGQPQPHSQPVVEFQVIPPSLIAPDRETPKWSLPPDAPLTNPLGPEPQLVTSSAVFGGPPSTETPASVASTPEKTTEWLRDMLSEGVPSSQTQRIYERYRVAGIVAVCVLVTVVLAPYGIAVGPAIYRRLLDAVVTVALWQPSSSEASDTVPPPSPSKPAVAKRKKRASRGIQQSTQVGATRAVPVIPRAPVIEASPSPAGAGQLPASAPDQSNGLAGVAVPSENAANPAISTATPATAQSPATSSPPVEALSLRVEQPPERVVPAHVIYRVEPLYPQEARQQHVGGTVRIRATVGQDGRMKSLRVLSGPPALTSAALDAAQSWRYSPALRDGHPVETEVDLDLEFHP